MKKQKYYVAYTYTFTENIFLAKNKNEALQMAFKEIKKDFPEYKKNGFIECTNGNKIDNLYQMIEEVGICKD